MSELAGIADEPHDRSQMQAPIPAVSWSFIAPTSTFNEGQDARVPQELGSDHRPAVRPKCRPRAMNARRLQRGAKRAGDAVLDSTL